MMPDGNAVEFQEISDRDVLCMRPLVSVVVLAYRHELYIADALESIGAQAANFELEIVVAEDSSPDQTRQVALEYQKMHPNLVRILAGVKNVGMMKNLQRALAACRGEFVCFCEGDDYWIDDSKVRRQVEALREHADVDICFHSAMFKHAATGQVTGPHARRGFRTTKTTLQKAIMISGFMPTASVMLRRSLCESLPRWLFNEAPFGDMYIYILGSRRGGAIYLDRPMSVYRTGVPTGWSVSIESSNELERVSRRYLTCLGYLERELGVGRNLFDRKLMRAYAAACLDAAWAGKKSNVEYALLVLRERGFVKVRHRAAVALLSNAVVRFFCARGRRVIVSVKYRLSLVVNAVV
jgi:glycosyltransferase involved in cell wall biosynthesis